ncbi:MAG: ABC transporter ATP-binding protein, partial [Lachnospiraceae bacterium]|nr:ABC transporter ATP-binding protein [Lachnospiraceae bacterium]
GLFHNRQNIRLFGNLSVKTNVMISCNMHSKYHLGDALLRTPRYREATKETEDCAMEFLDIVGLADKGEERASSLPYGHQRKLEIARAMATDPKLLLLDEPAAGMNADESLELVEFIRKLKQRFDITILMIEHHMDVVTNLCDACTVLNFGKTLATGTVEEIKKNPEVIAAYLGGDE